MTTVSIVTTRDNFCTKCNRSGHAKETCWAGNPALKRRILAQRKAKSEKEKRILQEAATAAQVREGLAFLVGLSKTVLLSFRCTVLTLSLGADAVGTSVSWHLANI